MKKKLLSAICFLTTTFLSMAQTYYYDSFDYSLGNLGVSSDQAIPAVTPATSSTNSNWNYGSTKSAVVQNGQLTYTGLVTSATSTRDINLVNTGSSVNQKMYITSNTAGAGKTTPIYYSFLLKVSSAPATVTRIFSLMGTNNGGGSGSTFSACVYAQSATNGYNLIIAGADVSSAPDAASKQTSEVLSFGTTILVVAKYTPSATASGGTTDFWINPTASSLGTTTAPSPTFANVTNGTIYDVNGGTIKTGSGVVGAEFDELRIGVSWAEVTPRSPVAGASLPSTDDIHAYFTNSKLIINGITGIKNIDVYSLQGKKILSATSGQDEIDTTDICKGVYLIKITSETGSWATKAIK